MARLKFLSKSYGQVQVTSGSSLYERYVAQTGQTVVTLLNSYSLGGHQLKVYRNGVFQELGVQYVELDAKRIQFLTPLYINDSVLLTVEGTFGSKLHEEYIASASQNVFLLSTPYHKGLKTLMVFRNGVLQRQAVDYTETDQNTVTLTYRAVQGDIFTFHEQT